jgi:hypothetical protein
VLGNVGNHELQAGCGMLKYLKRSKNSTGQLSDSSNFFGGFLRQSQIIQTIRNSVLAPGAVKAGCLSFTREVVIRAAFRPEWQHLRQSQVWHSRM